jgi:hypothetical protein
MSQGQITKGSRKEYFVYVVLRCTIESNFDLGKLHARTQTREKCATRSKYKNAAVLKASEGCGSKVLHK